MPSGNKILGRVYSRSLNLDIYISSQTITQGLCGSFNFNSNNDIFNRFTDSTVGALNGRRISADTSASWRLDGIALNNSGLLHCDPQKTWYLRVILANFGQLLQFLYCLNRE